MNRTDHSKVEVVAVLGLEQARAVGVEGADEDGGVGQDAVAEEAGGIDGGIDGEFRALARCAADGEVEGRMQGKIGPVVRALEAPARPLVGSGPSQKSRISPMQRARRVWS